MNNKKQKKFKLSKINGNTYLLMITILLFVVMYVAGMIVFEDRGFAKPQMLFTTALAAIDAVPKEAINDWTRTLPIWNILFSIPLGSLILRILLSIEEDISNLKRESKWIGSCFLEMTVSIITAPTTLDASDAIPAPIVPSL